MANKKEGKLKEDELHDREEIVEDKEIDIIENEVEIEEEIDNEKKLEEAENKYLRLQADFVNFKKRTEREKAATINYALEGFTCSLLPILDNFRVAMESESNKENSFYDGINLIYKQFLETLEEYNVLEVKALEEEFDPNFHHAVFMEESDEYEAGKVIEVLQTGYLLNEKVIRPAMVKVAK